VNLIGLRARYDEGERCAETLSKIGRLSDKVLWLDHGEIKMHGDLQMVTGEYLKVQ